MASTSHEGDTPKKESKPAVDTAAYPAPHGSQSPYPPPQVTYYPPPTGYPPCQVPYGYPPPGTYQPYAAQPPPPMYNTPTYGPQRSGGRSSCVRSFVLFMLLLMLWYFVLVIITSSIYSDDPFYTVDSLSVSNFSTTNSALTCIWNTKINISNPSYDANVTFTNFTVHVYYNHEELIQSQGKSLEVGDHQIGQLDVSAEYNSGVQPQLPNATVNAMAKDRDTGWLTFSLVLSAQATRTYESAFFLWTLKQTIEAECRDLKVRFLNGTGNATFDNEGHPVRCLLVLHY